MATVEVQGLPAERVQVERVWFCSKDGVNYISPRCGIGGSHRRVTVTTTVTVTEGWDGGDGDASE